MTQSTNQPTIPVRLIQLLSVAGLLVAFYLWLFHEGVLIAACSGGGWDDCGAVSGPNAPFATIGPISVALLGLLGYAGIFLLTWLSDWLSPVQDNLTELLLGLTGLGFLFSLALTGLEAFVIHAFCRFCLISAAIMTTMFGLAIVHWHQQR